MELLIIQTICYCTYQVLTWESSVWATWNVGPAFPFGHFHLSLTGLAMWWRACSCCTFPFSCHFRTLTAFVQCSGQLHQISSIRFLIDGFAWFQQLIINNTSLVSQIFSKTFTACIFGRADNVEAWWAVPITMVSLDCCAESILHQKLQCS